MSSTGSEEWDSSHPSNVQEMIDTLNVANSTVETLKIQLAAATETRDTIHHELLLYMASRAPINRIPSEILSLIFENCYAEQATRNKVLSLVCKSWRNTVVDTPRLWSHIIIRTSWEVRELRTLWNYAEVCLTRSRGVPLDIVVGLQEVLEYSQYLFKVLQEPFSWVEGGMIDESHSLHVVSLSPLHRAEDNYRQYENLMATTLNKLAGANREHVSRWRTLILTAPVSTSMHSVANIWNAVAGRHERLINFAFWIPFTSIKPPPDSEISYPLFPALRRFSTDQSILIEQLALNPSVLEHLHLHNDYTSNDFLHKATTTVFEALVTLDLSIWEEWSSAEISKASIHLPRLTSMKLRGVFSHVIAPLFNAPSLKLLYFQCYRTPLEISEVSIFTRLETLQLDLLSTRNVTTQPVDNTPLIALLMRSPALVSLRVAKQRFGPPSNLRNLITELRQSDTPLAHLREIVLVQGTDLFTQKEKLLSVLDVSL
jgi:F-box-like